MGDDWIVWNDAGMVQEGLSREDAVALVNDLEKVDPGVYAENEEGETYEGADSI